MSAGNVPHLAIGVSADRAAGLGEGKNIALAGMKLEFN